jgi:hypothetical protein
MYGEFLKVLLEDFGRAKERWSRRFGGMFGDDDVRLQDTHYDIMYNTYQSIYIDKVFEWNG